jgi:hypothetical protein
MGEQFLLALGIQCSDPAHGVAVYDDFVTIG